MKKIISLLLSLIMVFSLFTLTFAAESVDEDTTKYPIILVPGYSSSKLYRVDEKTGEQIPVWLDAYAQIAQGLVDNKEAILLGLAQSAATNDPGPMGRAVKKAVYEALDGMKCNDDGSSYYDVKNYVHTPEETNYKYLNENYPEGEHQAEKEMMGYFGDVIGEENTYVFTCDFRMGAVANANSLREYIDDVIEYTNKNRAEKDKIDKVNLFAVSHGGQVSGTYLTLYGYEGKVNNAVLTIPALGGAGIAYDIFNGHCEFDEVGLLTFVQHGCVLEEDYQIFLEAEKLGFLDELIDYIIQGGVEGVLTWGSLWDFIPIDKYEAIKAKHLDPVKNAEVIKKSDYMHYEIMSPSGDHYFAKGFKKAQQAGTNIYIMAGYDNKVITGLAENSDSIITTNASTGATCAPFGQRFADGYIQKVDTGFYQVSPSMTVDASTSYLPEHTWFIQSYYHGMTYYDSYTHSLLNKLILNDGAGYDVHTFKEYPQFHATTNPAHTVFAAFDSSAEGYLSSEDKALTIKNLSKENTMVISAVTVCGADFDFSFVPFALAPGESKSIAIKGDIPAVSVKNIEINVTYMMGTVTPIGERVFDFTIMNGEKVAFDAEKPLVSASHSQKIDEVLSGYVNENLINTGTKRIVSMLYNMIYKVVVIFDKLMAIFGK